MDISILWIVLTLLLLLLIDITNITRYVCTMPIKTGLYIFVTSPYEFWSCEFCPLAGLMWSWVYMIARSSRIRVVLLFHSCMYLLCSILVNLSIEGEQDCCGSGLYIH